MITSAEKDLLIGRALRGLNDLPPFSPVLAMLMAGLSRGGVPVTALAKVIEKDSILSGATLRVANSTLYGCRAVTSVTRAITVIGLLKLRNTTLSLSVSRICKDVRTPPGWCISRFNQHSLATAILSEQLAQRLPISYPETAFAAGLFHDLGKLLIATGLGEEYGRIARLGANYPEVDCERIVLGFTHADLCAAALKRWNLPANVRHAVAAHHAPDRSPADLYHGCKFHIGHVIGAADAIAEGFGFSLPQSPAAAGLVDMDEVGRALRRLGISQRPGEVLEDFRAEFEVMREQLN